LKPRITVVGSVNMDLVLRTARLPAPGETIAGSAFRTIPGGKGANQAVAAARLGAEVHFIGAVGSDDFGRQLRSGLAADGIGLAHLAAVAAESTGVAMILVDAGGQNSIVLSPGANACVGVEQIDAATDLIAGASMLVCQLEIPLPAVTRAIDRARAAGTAVLLNPAPAVPLKRELLSKVDYLVLNETEAALLSGVPVVDEASAEAVAARLLQQGAGQVLVTLGDKGVVSASQTAGAVAVHAIPVDVVDTTAAGDTFVGAFAVAVASGVPAPEAVEYAQHAAALAVTKFGAQSSIPNRVEVDGFIQTRRRG